jgi:hypothetical protein
MEIIRSYYNSDDDLIRVDRLHLEVRSNTKGIVNHQGIGTNTNVVRKLSIQPLHIAVGTAPGTPVSRVIAKLEVTGICDSIETSTGKYTWAKWHKGDGTDYILDMSDLPGCGDTV